MYCDKNVISNRMEGGRTRIITVIFCLYFTSFENLKKNFSLSYFCVKD